MVPLRGVCWCGLDIPAGRPLPTGKLKGMKHSRLAARTSIGLVMLAGAAMLAAGAATWHSTNVARFLLYLGVFVLAFGIKLRLPWVTGTLPVSEILIFFGFLRLGMPETLVLGCAGALVQELRHIRKRPVLIRSAFSVASMATAITLAYYAFHLDTPAEFGPHTVMKLFFAAGVFFLANTLLSTVFTAVIRRTPVFGIWPKSSLRSLPYSLLAAALAGGLSAADKSFGWEISLLALPVLYAVYRSYELHLARLEAEKTYAEQVASLHLRTIEALAAAIEARDETTHRHLERVQIYAVELGKKLRLNEEQIQALRAASILHDIGKLAVPEHIISKPGKLTPEEFEKMKIHPVVGAEILERVHFPYPVAPIVRSHHEKWNGTGYPDGLRGEEIVIGARILAPIDCLDALASERQYRRALPLEEAMRIVVSEAGKSYDPRIVEILQRHYREWEAMAQSQPSAREKLETNVQVELGEAPDAGLEKETSRQESRQQSSAGLKQAAVTSIATARQEVQALYEISQDLGASLSLEETLAMLDNRLKRLVAYDSISVYIREKDYLVSSYARGQNAELFYSLAIPVGEGLAGWVAENGKPIINGNPSVEAGYLRDPGKFSTLRSALAVPLESAGRIVGVLGLYHGSTGAFTRDELRLLQAIAPKLTLAVENALCHQCAQVSAASDRLTGLPNARSLFLRLDAELSRSRCTQSPVSVLLLDLNGFKRVNERFGYLAGNRVLKSVAGRLRGSCRDSDFVARMGGDEFAVILPGCDSTVVEGKMVLLSREVAAAGGELDGCHPLSVCIGTAAFPADGTDPEVLLAEADRNLHRAKSKNRPGASESLLSLLTHTGVGEPTPPANSRESHSQPCKSPAPDDAADGSGCKEWAGEAGLPGPNPVEE